MTSTIENSPLSGPLPLDLTSDIRTTMPISDSSNIMEPLRSNLLCRYYLRGICRFGSLCRFSHDVSDDTEASPISVTSSGPLSTTSGVSSATATNQNVSSTNYTSIKNKNIDIIKEINNSNEQMLKWADAPVFVPMNKRMPSTGAPSGTKTWSEVAGGSGLIDIELSSAGLINYNDDICAYQPPCPNGVYCLYSQHWELCELCDKFCLHPTDSAQRRKHNQECVRRHEEAMELSFAIARSKDKTCGICFDTIMEKAGREKRFGILPNCNHTFCLGCIRKWRQAKNFEHKITRSCPECRVSSDYVCPSTFWVDTKDDKERLLSDYHAALMLKDCKYFKKGEGKCPFGNKCFYKHALPDGKIIDVGLPKRSRKLHCSTNEIIDLLDIYLWDFVDQRDNNYLDLLSPTDESEESDWTEE